MYFQVVLPTDEVLQILFQNVPAKNGRVGLQSVLLAGGWIKRGI